MIFDIAQGIAIQVQSVRLLKKGIQQREICSMNFVKLAFLFHGSQYIMVLKHRAGHNQRDTPFWKLKAIYFHSIAENLVR